MSIDTVIIYLFLSIKCIITLEVDVERMYHVPGECGVITYMLIVISCNILIVFPSSFWDKAVIFADRIHVRSRDYIQMLSLFCLAL